LLLTAAERLNDTDHDRVLLGLRVGDPHDEVLGAWLAKESVRDMYLTDDPADAAVLPDKAIAGCAPMTSPRSSRAENTRRVAHRDPQIPPRHQRVQRTHRRPEPLVKKVKRAGHGFRSLEHYRPRVLLHAGSVT